jgi:hypothetical protein
MSFTAPPIAAFAALCARKRAFFLPFLSAMMPFSSLFVACWRQIDRCVVKKEDVWRIP